MAHAAVLFLAIVALAGASYGFVVKREVAAMVDDGSYLVRAGPDGDDGTYHSNENSNEGSDDGSYKPEQAATENTNEGSDDGSYRPSGDDGSYRTIVGADGDDGTYKGEDNKENNNEGSDDGSYKPEKYQSDDGSYRMVRSVLGEGYNPVQLVPAPLSPLTQALVPHSYIVPYSYIPGGYIGGYQYGGLPLSSLGYSYGTHTKFLRI